MNKSRRYREYKSKIEDDKLYPLEEVFQIIKDNKNFEGKLGGIRVSVSLNWKNQKNVLKGKVTLPNLVGSGTKIAIVKDDLSDELVNQLQEIENVSLLNVEEIKRIITKKKGQWGFSKLLALPESESKIKPLERTMAPKGVFPSKKNGLLTNELIKEIEQISKGEKIIKTDKGGNISVLISNHDFDFSRFENNFSELKKTIYSMKPVNWKGGFIREITFSTTMGPGIKTII